MTTAKATNRPFLPITFPHFSPINATWSYHHSKCCTPKLFPPSTFNDAINTAKFDRHVSVTLEKEATERLKRKRHFAAHRRKTLDEEWEKLRELESRFKNNIEYCNYFIVQNKEKRSRCLRRIDQFNTLSTHYESKTKNLQEKLNHLYAVKNSLEEAIGRMEMYEDYLTLVATYSNRKFRNADHIITTYESMTDIRKHIIQVEINRQQKLEEACESYKKDVYLQNLRLTGLINIQDMITNRYEKAREKSRRWENLIIRIREEMSIIKINSVQIKESCWYLYTNICKRKYKEPAIPRENFKDQLVVIKKTMNRLERVTSQDDMCVSGVTVGKLTKQHKSLIDALFHGSSARMLRQRSFVHSSNSEKTSSIRSVCT